MESWDYVCAFFWSNVRWSYFPLIPRLSYPLAGYAFYLIQTKENRVIKQVTAYRVHLLYLSLIILVLTGLYGIRISTRLEGYYYHDSD